MDGAGEFRTYLQIVMPVSIPTIISGALVMFTAQWNAFMWPLLVARSDKLKMLPGGAGGFPAGERHHVGGAVCGITISMVIPCVILIPFRSIISGESLRPEPRDDAVLKRR